MTHVHVVAVRSIRIVVEESNQKIYNKGCDNNGRIRSVQIQTFQLQETIRRNQGFTLTSLISRRGLKR